MVHLDQKIYSYNKNPQVSAVVDNVYRAFDRWQKLKATESSEILDNMSGIDRAISDFKEVFPQGGENPQVLEEALQKLVDQPVQSHIENFVDVWNRAMREAQVQYDFFITVGYETYNEQLAEFCIDTSELMNELDMLVGENRDKMLDHSEKIF